jgi:hypothetical protein
MDVNACFSSKDGPNCDYSDLAGVGVPGGTLDPLPAIPIVIAFATR